MDNKFVSLEEFKESIDMGLDLDLYLYGVRYYIGAPLGKLLISWDDGEKEIQFDSVPELLQYEINGKPLKDIWKDIEINSM